ncbi:MAG TPA: aminotransferase class IV [Gemmatimonadales bacterium]|nr:aminotransferase class IV [Gemmatimonadales bacterium]
MNSNAPALLETMRVRAGRIPLLDLHRRRLESSCRALGLPVPALDPASAGPDRTLRAEVSAAGAVVSERPLGSLEPVHLVWSSVVHEPYRHKTTARGQFDRTLDEARKAGADDGILLTRDGFVAESAIWTLFWWEGSQLAAPSLDLGILPAVSRARLAAVLGPIMERRVGPEGLKGRSLVVANAVRGPVPVASLGGQPVPPHPDTPRLARAFWP